MSEEKTFNRYVMYDLRRDRFTNHEQCETDEPARESFSATINNIPKDWEKRDRERYYLIQLGTVKGTEYTTLDPPRIVMQDWEVVFNPRIYWLKDPPYDEASEAAYDAAVARIQAADAAERARRRGNYYEPDATGSPLQPGNERAA